VRSRKQYEPPVISAPRAYVERDVDVVVEVAAVGVQMLQQAVGDLVGAGRAARAALVPARTEHEVADDGLPPTVEQVEQARLALRSLEDVVLDDLDHRQHAALDVQRVALPGELLLLDQQLLASNQPLVSRHGLRQGHSALLGIALHRAFDP
jgi:hypothetical protein